MAIINTTLTAKYVPNWRISHALREIISNAIDGDKDGYEFKTPRYSPKHQRLYVKNVGAKVPAEALLLGYSGSRAFEDKIGEFGEGLPLALLTIARTPGYDVKITNDDERWTPQMANHGELNAEVLQIKLRKLNVPTGNFEVVVDGVTQDDFNHLQEMFLRLNRSFDVSKTACVGSERVLLQDIFRGCIYNKGVLVTKRDDLAAGYDLCRTTNRDRELIDEWDLKWALQSMLVTGVHEQPAQFGPRLLEVPDNEKFLEGSQTYQIRQSPEAIAVVQEAFIEAHGEDAVAVSNMAEAKEVGHIGKRGIVVNDRTMEVLGAQDLVPTFETSKETLKMHVERHHHWHELTADQQDMLTRVTDIVHGVSGNAQNVNVVDFTDPDLRGSYHGATGEIRISYKLLESGDEVQLMHTMIHEAAHAAGGDGTVEHERRQMDIASEIIVSLMAEIRELKG